MMTLKTELTLPAAGLSGFEPPLAEEEAAIQAGVHRFAREVLRPLGAELDRMTAAAVIAPGSPYYGVFAEFAKLGLDPFALAELPPDMAVRIESLIGEELGWETPDSRSRWWSRVSRCRWRPSSAARNSWTSARERSVAG